MAINNHSKFLFSPNIYNILHDEESVAEFRNETLEYLKKNADAQAILLLAFYVVECYSVASCQLKPIISNYFDSILSSLECFTQEIYEKIKDKHRIRLCTFFQYCRNKLSSNIPINCHTIQKENFNCAIKIKRNVGTRELAQLLIKHSKKNAVIKFLKHRMKYIENLVKNNQFDCTSDSSSINTPKNEDDCHLLDLIVEENE